MSAFAAANVEDGKAYVAYSVYCDGKEKILRSAYIDGITLHRAILTAIWSAVSYCRTALARYDISVYSDNKTVVNELSAAWMGMNKCDDFNDADRIRDILTVCCHIRQVASGYCTTDGDDNYSRRMKELTDMLT